MEDRIKDLELENGYLLERIKKLEDELYRVYYRFIHLYTYLNEKDAEITYPGDEEVDSWIREAEDLCYD